MDSRDLGQWMQSEYERVHELANRLREHIVSRPRGELTLWLKELSLRYDHFAAHVLRHLELEEEDGYLLPVLEQRPTLARQVEILRHEHDEIKQLIKNVGEAVHALKSSDSLLIRDCCTRIQVLLGHVERHGEHENHMVLYVFTQDMGTK